MTKPAIPNSLLMLSTLYTIYAIYLLFTQGISNLFNVYLILAVSYGVVAKSEGALITLKILVIFQILMAAILLMYFTVFGTNADLYKQFETISATETPSTLAIVTYLFCLCFQGYVAFSTVTRSMLPQQKKIHQLRRKPFGSARSLQTIAKTCNTTYLNQILTLGKVSKFESTEKKRRLKKRMFKKRLFEMRLKSALLRLPKHCIPKNCLTKNWAPSPGPKKNAATVTALLWVVLPNSRLNSFIHIPL